MAKSAPTCTLARVGKLLNSSWLADRCWSHRRAPSSQSWVQISQDCRGGREVGGAVAEQQVYDAHEPENLPRGSAKTTTHLALGRFSP